MQPFGASGRCFIYWGGVIKFYLVFNALLIPVVLLGYKQVVQTNANALISAKFCTALGVLTFAIHCGFTLAGFEQFNLPLSITIILLFLPASIWQLT